MVYTETCFQSQGDSGGPLFYFDTDLERYFQGGIVSGGLGECGQERIPGVFVRVDHPEVLGFIASVTDVHISGMTNP